MLITDRLVFLHLQKTGGQHVGRILLNRFGAENLGAHARPTPEQLHAFNNRLIVSAVRNPWSWYISLWSYGCQRKGSLYQSLTRAPGSITFRKPVYSIRQALRRGGKPVAAWHRVYADSSDPNLFRQWLWMILDPARSGDFGEDYADSPLHEFAGLMTYRYLKLVSRTIDPLYDATMLSNLDQVKMFDSEQNILHHIIRTENLLTDLMDVLVLAGYEINEDDRTELEMMPHTNQSKRRPTSEYYDNATSDLITRREAFMVEKYDYAPPIK